VPSVGSASGRDYAIDRGRPANSGSLGAVHVITEKVTDSCAAGAVCLFGVTLTTIDLVVQIVAGTLTAIVAGVSFYGIVVRWWNRRK
jgi:hypothetical protein